MKKYIMSAFVVVLFFSCDKRISISNPYDDEYPKDSFSPYNFQASQIGKKLLLKWQNTSYLNNFSHYKLLTKIDNTNNPQKIISKDSLSYIQEDIQLDKIYNFNLAAVAGNNISNEVNLSVKINAIVTTIRVINISSRNADVQANIQAASNNDIRVQGFVFREMGNINVTSTTSQSGGIGNYTINLFTLKPNTTYVGYATCLDINGKVYRGEDITFTTLP
jgi:hypothetical protein